VQATVFPIRDFCLSISIHYAAYDDASTMNFICTEAATYCLVLESGDGSAKQSQAR
jgi:hypothetical protein